MITRDMLGANHGNYRDATHIHSSITHVTYYAEVVSLKTGFLYTLSVDYAMYIGSKAGQTGYPVCYAEDVNSGWILQELNATVTKDAVCECGECNYESNLSLVSVCACVLVR